MHHSAIAWMSCIKPILQLSISNSHSNFNSLKNFQRNTIIIANNFTITIKCRSYCNGDRAHFNGKTIYQTTFAGANAWRKFILALINSKRIYAFRNGNAIAGKNFPLLTLHGIHKMQPFCMKTLLILCQSFFSLSHTHTFRFFSNRNF